MFALFVGVASFAGDAKPVEFNIKAGDLATALNQFARQSGQQISATTEVTRDKQSAAIRGPYEPHQALRMLLKGTDLTAKFADHDTVVVTTAEARTAPRALSVDSRSTDPIRLAAVTSDVAAAAPQASEGLGEIIVTARKREESLRDVPIDEQVIPAARLEALQVINLTDLPQLAPGLNFGKSLLSIGTLVSIRGIGTASQDPGVDQSVSLNIDGMPISNGLAFGGGMFDVGQVEVLKGPQALFFGKSTPGGVISLRTADPTNEFELVGTAAYEFESVQPRAEVIVSGPVSDTLKLRFAGMYDHEEGYFYKDALAEPNTGATPPAYTRDPWGDDFVLRGTALWDPSPQFSARLKLNMVYDRNNTYNEQYTACPSGTTPLPGLPNFIGGNNTCRLGRTLYLVDVNPADFPGVLNGGTPFLMTDQRFGTLELNYRPTPVMALSSTTSYYHLSSSSMIQLGSTYAGPFSAANDRYSRHDFTEEVRANSDFHIPLNFTVGAFFEDGQFQLHSALLGNKAYAFPQYILNGTVPVDDKTYSVFGQLRWDIIDKVELAAGVRWSDETRDETPFTYTGINTEVPTPVPVPSIHNNNTSPEATVTYKPTDDLTLYAAYKQGFKSGSFSIATPATANVSNAFGPEKVHGEEVGLKSLLLDHQLALNVTSYYYRYTGLQVGVNTLVDGLPVDQTLNAASAVTYGIDLDGAFRPAAIQGLQLNGAAEWNHARYLDFTNAPCWGGQTIALGCNQLFSPATGLYTAQSLSGTPLIRAPDYQANLGFDYTMPVLNDHKLTVSNNYAYSSRYTTELAVGYPGNAGYQSARTLIDLGLTLRAASNVWEVALIGKNITNKVTTGNCLISSGTGGTFVGIPSGMATPSPYGYDTTACFPDPGLAIWLRLTVRPFASR